MSDDKRAVTLGVMERLVEQGFMFTALDVSNEVKIELDGVRHREISPIVRELFDDGALGDDYTRTTIDVLAGGKTVQAFLYHHEDDDPDDYDGDLREQKAKPPGARRGSSGGAPAPAADPKPAAPAGPNLDVTELSLRRQRDGSIEIPSGFLERAGIYDDIVHLDAAGIGSGLVIVPPDSTKDPLAELDVEDVVVVPADRLSAYDGTSPIIVRRAARKLEIEGTLR